MTYYSTQKEALEAAIEKANYWGISQKVEYWASSRRWTVKSVVAGDVVSPVAFIQSPRG